MFFSVKEKMKLYESNEYGVESNLFNGTDSFNYLCHNKRIQKFRLFIINNYLKWFTQLTIAINVT